MKKAIEKIYNQVAGRYDGKYVQPIHRAEDSIMSVFAHMAYQPGRTVLDIGCGTGEVISLGEVKPEDYTGIDISDGMLEKAGAKYPGHHFLHADATAPLVGEFDVIFAVYGQVNYFGLDRFVEILVENMKGGGKYFAVLYSGEDNIDCAYTKKYQKHYSPEDILKAFAGTGLKVNLVKLDFDGKIIREGTAKYFILSN